MHKYSSYTKYIFYGLLLVIVGCATNVSTSKNKYKIGFSQCCADPWRDMMNAEMRRELAFHPELDFQLVTANNISDTQIEQIQTLVADGVDLLIVAPNESIPLTPVIEQVYQSGVPVVLIDRKIQSDQYTAFLGGDNFEIGQIAGEYVANQLNGKANILELQISMAISPAVERSNGFRKAIAAYPNMEMVATLPSGGTIEKVDSLLPLLLEQHPSINLIYGHTDNMVKRAAELLKEGDIQKECFLIGVDGMPGEGGGLEAIEQGMIDATLLYPTGGEEAIKIAADILNTRSFQKENALQTTVIDKSNVRVMTLQSEKIQSQQYSIERQQEVIDEQIAIYRNQRTALYLLVVSLITALLLGILSFKAYKDKQEAYEQLTDKNEEILAQRNQIETISKEAEAANRAKFEFFTNISHEFRTPLTLILGSVEGLSGKGVLRNKNAQQDVGLIQKNAFRLLRLVNQLMDFRKIENKKMLVKASENDLVAFIQTIMSSFERIAKQQNTDFRLFTREATIPMWFDTDMMDKVLFNLLSNAFKFTKEGGRIHLLLQKDDINKQVILQVEDNGRGMSEEHTQHVFDRFYQGEHYKTKGTGLGLSLSKELIELHHGTIAVWSKKGKGTRFEIKLPLGNTHFEKEQLHTITPTTISSQLYIAEELESMEKVTPKKTTDTTVPQILIIEDNEELRQFLSQKLSTHFITLEAANGTTGIQQAMQHIPDLIISDVMMPEQDGLSLTKTLKLDLRTSHIPIILLTAQSDTSQKVAGLQTGADAYITKPFEIAYLRETINSLLRNRQLLKERYTNPILQTQNLDQLNQVDSEFVQQFTQLIAQHYADQSFQVQVLCEAFQLSRTQLYRKVKALLGQSVSDFIQTYRLEKAKQLLLEGELPIAEIAYQVGYTSSGYFATAFKGKFEQSPSEFRKGVKN